MPKIKLNPLKSNNLSGILYKEAESTLIISFYSGKVYSYTPITKEGYLTMLNAPSVGRYFSENIRNHPNITCTTLDSDDFIIPAE
jgi:hypothetical protein